jgi:hypothetical protein
VTLRARKKVAMTTISSVHTLFMHEFGEERRRELLREAERWQLARRVHEARKARAKECSGEGYVRPPDGRVDVRWGLLEDEPKIADILELNGMPRWVAYEERFIVAEREGKVLAAVRYRTEPKWLLLGLLVTDPWAEERSLAEALYFGAGKLAREMGLSDVWAKADRRVDYPHRAGYRRLLGGWHLEATRPLGDWEELPGSGWRRVLASLSALTVPFFRAFLIKKDDETAVDKR